jgi:hypothetical protein
VRESRMAFQVATTDEFVGAVEGIVGRKVHAFASATDVVENVVFENFVFEPDGSADGRVSPTLAGEAQAGSA